MEINFLINIKQYYSDKIKLHGASPAGVDWNSKASQEVRFRELCKLINVKDTFTVLDYGCGYGALLAYLKQHYSDFNYTGYDISDDMLLTAKEANSAQGILWTNTLENDVQYDFVLASGLFNVRQDVSDVVWLNYILSTLDSLNKLSIKGFAFNILTMYSDLEYMKEYLYYADPGFLFNYCKTNYSKQVALLHDYDLYEFTIIVRK